MLCYVVTVFLPPPPNLGWEMSGLRIYIFIYRFYFCLPSTAIIFCTSPAFFGVQKMSRSKTSEWQVAKV